MADIKRKKKTLSLEQKVEILRKLENGVKANRLAMEYEVSESAITYIKKIKKRYWKQLQTPQPVS